MTYNKLLICVCPFTEQPKVVDNLLLPHDEFCVVFNLCCLDMITILTLEQHLHTMPHIERVLYSAVFIFSFCRG